MFNGVIPSISGYYGLGYNKIELINVDPCEPGHRFYTLKIPHLPEYINQPINIMVDVKPKNLVAGTTISTKAALSFNSAIGIERQYNIAIISF